MERVSDSDTSSKKSFHQKRVFLRVGVVVDHGTERICAGEGCHRVDIQAVTCFCCAPFLGHCC